LPSERDLYESLDSALWTLGVPTRNLVISTIESRGLTFRPHEVDFKAVDRVLLELFGIGSSAIMNLAWRRLDSKMLMGFDESRVSDPVEKIKRWLAFSGNQEQTIA
jgi:hypothetical protein